MEFTREQQQVIDLHGRNILVSAAAGSGKTAVLVERIVKMISEGERPADIDRLLVVTFTNAAAAQMRERIGLAIAERLRSEPGNEHLQRQSTLIHNAQITTIDSFCLFIIRNNFNDIGLDPGFRVADEGELRLLKKDVLGRLIEESYAGGEERYLACVDFFCTGGRDEALEDYILKLYDFAMSNPWPEDWLRERIGDYRLTLEELRAVKEEERPSFVSYCIRQAERAAMDCAELIRQCERLCLEPDGPYMYGETLEREAEMVEGLAAGEDYVTLAEAFGRLSFGRLPSKKDDSVSPLKRELVQNIRKEVKAVLGGVRESYFALSPEQAAARMRGCEGAVEALVELTLSFKEAFDRKKREKNIVDFQDMEHFALSILVRKAEDGYEPTRTAMDYRAYFEEILIDEYQDSNMVQELLLKSISGEDEGSYNRFMVGDVKQSIYKFRLARPEIFMEKYDTYTADKGPRQRIELSRNFRSRPEVLSLVNYVFERLMGKELGGVEYDEAAALYPGASYPSPEKEGDCAAELLLIRKKEKGEEESGLGGERRLTGRQQEAVAVAGRIRELIREFKVTDKDTGELRPVRYQDMVILLRTTAGWDEEFRQILQEEGIPAYVASKTGYFAAPEIRTILQLLRVLDNPLQDIPLFGVMRSQFGGFTDEEAAWLRASCREEALPLYEALKRFAGGGGEPSEEPDDLPEDGRKALNEKTKRLLSFLADYREKAVYMPIHELLRRILTDTGYLWEVAVMPAGEQRKANVEMLLKKAEDFEKTSYTGLFHFVRYVEQLERFDVDYGEANILDENANVVRIMSIHKSKGLEFPVCFVCGLAKKFNMQDTNGRLIADVDMGIGVDYVDSDLRVQGTTLRKRAVAAKMKEDSLGEELRVLYVAMTRAKEKLILTGMLDHAESRAAALVLRRKTGDRLSCTQILRSGSALDLLLPALAAHSAFQPIWDCLEGEAAEAGAGTAAGEKAIAGAGTAAGEKDIAGGEAAAGDDPPLRVSLLSLEQLAAGRLREVARAVGDGAQLRLSETVNNFDPQLSAELRKKFTASYPHANLAGLYTKTTVSELKKAAREEEEVFAVPMYEEEKIIPYLPAFMRKEEALSGAARGTAFHKAMELFPFGSLGEREEDWEGEVRTGLAALAAERRLPEEYAAAVQAGEILAFLRTGLGRRMVRAGRQGCLHREQPFVLGLPASCLNRDFPPGETVLIQGIIDAWFEEEDGLVVADYKTDAVSSPGELVRKYAAQLDYYAQALERLTGRMVKEKIIYSFTLREEIPLPAGEISGYTGENPG